MKTTPYQTIGFIGLGLIGGSIALAIKERYPAIRLYAHAHSQATITQAHDAGIIENKHFLNLEELAAMDVLFLCSPVTVNVDYLKQLAPLLGEQTLITDVGSVKGDIMTTAKNLGLSSRFVGGHPMTGSENSGFSNAASSLLENAFYILAPLEGMAPHRYQRFSDFISSLGPIVIRLDPKLHDFSTAAISHLPHIIAATLVNLVKDNDSEDGTMARIAAGGFKDITRIASSSPKMWHDICLENRDPILRLIDLYVDALQEARRSIREGDSRKITSLFSNAKDYRDSLPVRQHSILPETFDFYLDLRDEAGQIRDVAVILADKDINIKNIGIVHNREFQQGVLHITLYDPDSKESAMTLLAHKGYHIYRK